MTAAEIAVNVTPVPPPRFGSMVWTRNASMIPANAPSTLVIMKFPILILVTLMPASVAPSRFPPTDTVCSPHRVLVSTMWKSATITRHQMSSAQSPAPSQDRIRPSAAAGISRRVGVGGRQHDALEHVERCRAS